MKRRAASVVYCVQKPGGWDVLLLRRCYRQDWTTPGGYADTGETFYQALEREFREETGVMFLPGDSAAEHVAGAGCPQLSSLPKEHCMHYLDLDLKKVALRLYVHFSAVPWSGFQANKEIDSCALLDLELLKYSVLRGTPLGLLLRNCVQQSFSCLFEQVCARQTKGICLVRHSEAAHNVSSANKGIQDPQLTAYGERQARNLKGRLEMYAAGPILTSPLQRACQTACILSCGHRRVIALECLKECGQTHACSRRSNMSILHRQFPQVDWTYICRGLQRRT